MFPRFCTSHHLCLLFGSNVTCASLLQGSSGSAASSPYDCMFEENDVDNVAVLTISVQGKQYSISPQEVSQMPLQAFSALWTVHILHCCLLPQGWDTFCICVCCRLDYALFLHSCLLPFALRTVRNSQPCLLPLWMVHIICAPPERYMFLQSCYYPSCPLHSTHVTVLSVALCRRIQGYAVTYAAGRSVRDGTVASHVLVFDTT